MIPQAYLQAWRAHAPWPDLRQVEQDLVICRALCDLFNDPFLKDRIAFRGGTAINKLLFQQALRYSEDIDLVQRQAEPIGATGDAIRKALSWLGKCQWKQTEHSLHMIFKFVTEVDPDTTLKLKVEINTREHESLYGIKAYPFVVSNSWYQATTDIASYQPEELFGTKLRALLQRRKNRDLFDINEGLKQLPMENDKLVACFEHYLKLQDQTISRAVAEENMLKKLNSSLTDDVTPLLPVGVSFSEDEAVSAFSKVWIELIARIKGEPWKLSEKVINEIRQKRYPKMLDQKA
jgi:predicted nucleotidyltransferase component of viral defense system